MSTNTLAQEAVQQEINRVLATEPNPAGLQYDSELLWRVADNMQATAGSFVRLVGELWVRADGFNQQKILLAWSNYFIQYAV